jgi:hypothetical protein
VSRSADPSSDPTGSAPDVPARVRRRAWSLAVAVALFAWVLFPLRSEWLNPPTRATVFGAPDGAPGSWDGARLADALRPLDDASRAAYAWSEVTLDGVFPILYAALLILVLRSVWRPEGSSTRVRVWRWAILLVPVGAAAADEIENVALFHAARAPVWTSGGDVGAALAAPARVISAAGPAKAALLGAGILLVLLGLAAAGRLGRAATLAWLARVPILGVVALVALAALGASDQVSPTIPNLLLLDGFWQTFFFAAMAALTAVVAGFSWVLVWERGPERMGAGEAGALPDAMRRMPAGSVGRGFPFLLFTVPLLVRALTRSAAVESRPLSSLLPGAAAGLAAAVLVVALVERIRMAVWQRRIERTEREGPRASGFARDRTLMRWVGAEGYADENGLYPGHGVAAAGALAGAIAYAAFHFGLAPQVARSGAPWIPTAAYVLGLLTVLVSLLTGVTFFFDRWRVPLVGLVLVWMALFGTAFPIRHEFPWSWSAQPLPAVGSAARARLAVQGDSARVLTIVTASGGGIQAAAWAAPGLPGVDQATSGRFSRSVVLFSGVSGGSVGGYFALSAFDSHGALAPGRRGAVVAAAEASSLEETAWGLLFPDLQRAFVPFTSPIRDRGWAMERGWLRARRDHLGGEARALAAEDLGRWAGRARAGLLPAVVFNATRIDDGLPLRLSTVAAADDAEGGLTSRSRYGRVPPRPGYLDLATVTAARLSATFPYVSPITQPEATDPQHDLGLVRWHAADGGYFDNHGTTAALEWLADLERECAECLADPTRIVWLQIDPFPPPAEEATAGSGGWTLSAFGPVLGLARVRTGSQRVRRAEELDLLEKRYGARLEVVTVAPPAPDPRFVTRDPPLSWFLSSRDRDRLEADWKRVATGPAVARLVAVYAGAQRAAGSAPPPGVP